MALRRRVELSGASRRGNARSATWLVLLAAFCSHKVHAQYRFDSWTTENGLPNNWVVGLHQTRDGYLWLTTFDGIARFDGVRFRIFNKSNTPGLTTNRFAYKALWEDNVGNLWMGTEDGGAIRYHDGIFTALTTKEGLPGNHIIRIDQDATGTVWIITDAGVMRWRNGHLLPQSEFDLSLRAYLIAPKNVGGDGHNFGLWRLTSSGWERFAYGQWTAFPWPSREKLEINGIAEDANRQLWFSVRSRLHEYYCVNNGHLMTYHSLPNIMTTQVCCEDAHGRLWLSNHFGVVGFWTNGQFTPLSGIATSNIFQALEDREGNLWIATLDHGLYRLRKEVIRIYRRPGDVESNLIGPMWPDERGAVWVRSGGLAKFADGQFQSYYRPGQTHYAWDWANMFSSLYKDRDGSLWADMWDGTIVRFKEGRFHDEKLLSTRIKGRLYGMLRDRAGDLWFGGVVGLYRLHGEELAHYTTRDGLPDNLVNVLHEDRAGNLWIGTKSGLTRYSRGEFMRVARLDGSNITALYEDDTGILWVGTHDTGLNRVANVSGTIKVTRYTIDQGLYSNTGHQILEDDLGFLWMSCDLGLFRMRKQELNDFAAGRTSQITSVHFGQADGLVSQCNSEAQPLAFKARDGRLWFATQNGIAVIDPKIIPHNPRPPPIEIEECLLDHRPVAHPSDMRVHPGQANLEIHYTALSFIKSVQIRFKYKLDGLDTDWVEAGTRRTAYYSHLPPGDYAFHVTAANSDGIWNTEGKTLSVIVLPPFYRTWWFSTIALLTAAGLLMLAWRSRIVHLKHQHALQQEFTRQLINSQEGERNRIASELHDSLGQHLLVIKNWTMLALGSIKNGDPSRECLNEISTAAQEAIEEVRGIAYNLRPYQLEKLGLTTAIQDLVNQVSASSGIRVMSEVTCVDGAFSHEEEISIYRVIQEALNNTIRHSKATEARVTLARHENSVELTLYDNGDGFDPQAVAARPRGSGHSGFGLVGIAERIRMLGGRMDINSAPQAGSTIRISLGIQ
jgi:signal transduction histidine kinase/ligand-binding sensor domain-containing protein